MSTTTPEPDPLDLVRRAREALGHAHAPYSGFRVGAIVVDADGRLFTGVNVENASYGLSMCAERVAIFNAIAAGAQRIRAVAVAAESREVVTPCGACRQVMAEFCAADTPVYCGAGEGKVATFTVGLLLPHAFLPETLTGSTPPRSAM